MRLVIAPMGKSCRFASSCTAKIADLTGLTVIAMASDARFC